MSEPTFQPGGSLAPVVWIEVTTGDGLVSRIAVADLPDDPSYYGGLKSAGLLNLGVVVRALSSDDDGSYESQRLDATVDDTARTWRTKLGSTDVKQRVLVDALLVLRVISDADRRAALTPLTAAMGLVRGYTTG